MRVEDPLPGPGDPVSSYQTTSLFVRSLVSSLTALVNGIAGVAGMAPADFPASDGPPVSPAALLDGLREDYTQRNYLWTGNIDASLYDPGCVFTDPTLSFKGLETFQRNVANLRPILNKVVPDGACDLFSIEMDEGTLEVCAKWRMFGTLRLPWRPRLDLTGRTNFRFDPARGGRVVDYREQWDISAADALLQLVRAGEVVK